MLLSSKHFLAAEKCYQPNARAAVAQLTAKLGKRRCGHCAATASNTPQGYPAIEKEAVRLLGADGEPRTHPNF